MIENLNERSPTEEEAASDREADMEPQPRVLGNEIYRSDDRGEHWRRVSPDGVSIGSKAAYSFNEIRVDPAGFQERPPLQA